MTHFVYDPTELVVTFVNGPLCRCGNGTNRAFTWDQFLRITSVTDGDGPTHAVTLAYNRDIVNTSPGGTFTVQAFPGPTSVVEPLRTGHTRTIGLTYFPTTDVRRDLINQATFPSVDPSGSHDTLTNTFQTDGTFTKQSMVGLVNGVATTFTATATYDSKGRIKTFVGPRTDVVAKYSFIYFPDTSSDLFKRGQLQTITDPLSHVTSIANGPSPFNTYDLFGNAKSMTDQNSVVTEYTYDGNGRPLTNTLLGVPGDPANLTTTFGYDAVGRLNSITRPGGNGVSATYDAAGRLTHIVRVDATLKQNERLTLSYDNVSELTGEDTETCSSPMPSCPSWTTTQQDSFSYDSNARLHKVVHPIPVGAQIVYDYDGAGNLTSVTDENHSAANATIGYDLANRPVTLTQKLATASGGTITTSLTYDDLDDVTQVSDPNGNLTQLAVDDFGRIRQQISPVSGTSTYSHDPDGNLVALNDANSSSTTAIYDALDRLTSMSAVQGTSVENVAFSYDDPTNGHFGIGELATMTDPTGSSTYTYERRGKVTSDVQVINGSSFTTGFVYDSNGNPSAVTYPSTRLVTYGYDFADRPSSAVSGGTTYVSGATYEPFGPIASLTFGNQTKQTLSYDQRYEPTENKLINTSAGTAPIADYTYGEDPAGNITSITDTMSTAVNRSFGYDDLNRLTSANSSVWGTSGNGYTYDNMGNVKSATLGSLYSASFSYVGSTPKISSVIENGTNRPVSYDNAGNEKSAGGVTYNYSPRELLSSSSDGLSYGYNGLGIRSISTDAGVGSRDSFYSPNLNLMSESKAVQSGSPSIDYDYIWFSGRPVAQVNSNVGNSGTYWTFADHLGTPIVQTDINRAVPWRAEYEPFGDIATLRAGDVHQPLRFPGQVSEQFDNGANGATERSYNLTRFYRPNWGRYTQPDEIGLNGGLDLFRYAGDNPIRQADPDGKFLLFLLIPVIAGIGQGAFQAMEAIGGGCDAGQAFRIGFVSGFAGGIAGELITVFGGGPAAGGAGGGIVDELVQDGLSGEPITLPGLLVSGAAGGVFGKLGFPEAGRRPDLFKFRDLSDLGPNSLREGGQSGFGGFVGTGVADTFLQRDREGGPGCGCI